MFEKLNASLGTLVVILLIFVGGMFFLKLPIFKLIFSLPNTTKKEKSTKISPFRAMSVALAGTLGVGNIVGVASAIYLGGFGSIFWMWVSAFCAMLLKYAEIVLAMNHRRYDSDGRVHGSAMHYIRDFLFSIGLKKCAKFISMISSSLTMIWKYL